MKVSGPMSAVKMWKEYLQRASRYPTDPAGVKPADTTGLKLLAQNLRHSFVEDLTPKEWNQLVLELKAPLKLSQLLRHERQLPPGSGVLLMLSSLLPKEGCAHYLSHIPAHPENNSNDNSTSLAAVVAQQLEQSQLLQQLSTLLTSAIDRLKACSQAAFADTRSQQELTRTHVELLMDIANALQVCSYVLSQADLELLSTTAAEALIPPVMQASCALLQDLSKEAVHWDRTGRLSLNVAPMAMQAVVHSAAYLLQCVVAASNEGGAGITPSRQHVVMSPHFMSYIATMSAMFSLGCMIKDGSLSKADSPVCKQSSTSGRANSRSKPGSSNRNKSSNIHTSSNNSSSSCGVAGGTHQDVDINMIMAQCTQDGNKSPLQVLANDMQDVSDFHQLVLQHTLNEWKTNTELLSAVPPHFHKLFEELRLDGRFVVWGARLLQQLFSTSQHLPVATAALPQLYMESMKTRLQKLSRVGLEMLQDPGAAVGQAQHCMVTVGRLHVLLLIVFLQHGVDRAKVHAGHMVAPTTTDGFAIESAIVCTGLTMNAVGMGQTLRPVTQQPADTLPAEWRDEVLPLVLECGNWCVQQLATAQSQGGSGVHSTTTQAPGNSSSSSNTNRSSSNCSSKGGPLTPPSGDKSASRASSSNASCSAGASAAGSAQPLADSRRASLMLITRIQRIQECIRALLQLIQLLEPLSQTTIAGVASLLDGSARVLATQAAVTAAMEASVPDLEGWISQASEGAVTTLMKLTDKLCTGLLKSPQPCSPERSIRDCSQQVGSLLCSLVKLVSNIGLSQAQSTAYLYHQIIALTAQFGSHLQDARELSTMRNSNSSNPAACSNSSRCDSSLTTSTAGCQMSEVLDPAANSTTPPTVVPKQTPPFLSSLVVAGRCCLQFGQLLHAAASAIPAQPASPGPCSPAAAFLGPPHALIDSQATRSDPANCQLCGGTCLQRSPYAPIAAMLLARIPRATFMPGAWRESSAMRSRMQQGLFEVGDLLLRADISAWLSAVGYDAQSLQQQVDDLNSAYHGAVQKMTTANLTALIQQLRATGLALTSLAVPVACNNPWCSNVSGPTELQLVSGRGCLCAGCLTARYCSKDCQRHHWKQHKPVCKALKQAAAAAAVS